jgi:hypothetical protein
MPRVLCVASDNQATAAMVNLVVALREVKRPLLIRNHTLKSIQCAIACLCFICWQAIVVAQTKLEIISDPFIKQGDADLVRFRVVNDNAKSTEIKLAYSLKQDSQLSDYLNANDESKSDLSFVFDAKPGNSEFSLPAKDIPNGCFVLRWHDANQSTSTIQAQHLFIRPHEHDYVNKALTRRFGINSSNPKLARLMSECGFGWVRFENGKWNMSSTSPDHYAFDGSVPPWYVNQDAIYKEYQDLDMKVMPYVLQTPEWATTAGDIKVNRAGYPPKNAADYGEAIYQFVARFGSQQVSVDTLKSNDKKSGTNGIDAIELWNEPNLVGPEWAAFVGSMENYFELMRYGAQAARKADPDLIVTSCGWAGVELATLKQMTDFRYDDGTCPLDLVDVINVHFYSGQQEPELALEDPNTRKVRDAGPAITYLEQLDQLIAWRDDHKPTAQIWLTETGNDVGGPIGLTERKQAAKLPRVVMITLAKGIDKVFIYRESGSQPSMHAGAGLVRDDGSLRPSWLTMATMIRQLQGIEGKVTRLPHPDPNVWLLKWTHPDRSVVAAWSIGEPVKLDLLDYNLLKPKRIIDAFGGEIAVQTSELNLGEFPVYITY